MFSLRHIIWSNKLFKLPTRQLHQTFRNNAIITTNDIPLYYETAGEGDNVALCLPGALGSGKTDFSPQLEYLANNNLKLIAWDPPGYGNSRPPSREFSLDFFKNDAALASQMMKNLGYNKYSLLGWSDGGITSLILAATCANNVEKIVIWGANAFVTEDDVNIYKGIRDISKWSERMRAPMEEMYGKEYFKTTWENWIDMMIAFYEENNGDICKEYLPAISCPTLIIHGAKDAVVPNFHPFFIYDKIKNSELVVWDEGKHNLHLRYADKFNELVTNFLTPE